ncbi:RDD family protein [Adhaeribacter soli]|uniref:RDD family protein n=1 Tax=Adhaeribacter soli TaxID=2607655 RepID=A0A5N1IU27_9BACT|nr:RDD family protein [Adhaeribacter soli]KAA9333695.1 RDD family protein [Adhaeribacter soli]
MNPEYPSTHNWHIENDQEPMPTAVSWNVRLVNYLIDNIFLALCTSFIMATFFPEEVIAANSMLLVSIMYPLQFAYYFLCEHFFGRTLAKVMTNCYVTTEYNEKPPLKAILLRTLCRHIPFEYFSFLGNGIGWHDKFSKTFVVRKAA